MRHVELTVKMAGYLEQSPHNSSAVLLHENDDSLAPFHQVSKANIIETHDIPPAAKLPSWWPIQAGDLLVWNGVVPRAYLGADDAGAIDTSGNHYRADDFEPSAQSGTLELVRRAGNL